MLYNAMDARLQRDEVLQYIRDKQFKRVIDFGGALGPWARDVVTHYFDFQTREQMESNIHPTTYPTVPDSDYFVGDMSNPYTWKDVLSNTWTHGKFDFAICTQTLEHVFHPALAIKLLEETSKEGFLGFPSKYTELRRGIAFGDEGLPRCGVQRREGCIGSPWRGFLPHRWIVTLREGALWFWPKVNAIEYLDGLEWADLRTDEKEMSCWWEHRIPYFIVTDDMLDHPDPQKACELYRKELAIGL